MDNIGRYNENEVILKNVLCVGLLGRDQRENWRKDRLFWGWDSISDAGYA